MESKELKDADRLLIGGASKPSDDSPPDEPPELPLGDNNDGNGDNNKGGWWERFGILTITLAVYMVIVTIVKMFVISDDDGINWWLVTIFGSVAHFIMSIKVLDPTDMGIVLFLDRPLYEIRKGPVFVPWILFSLRTITQNVIQMEFGTVHPDDVGVMIGSEGTSSMTDTEPLRITFAPRASTDEESLRHLADDPLSKRLTFDPRVVVRFRINDYPRFLEEIGTLQDAQRQLRDSTVAVLQRYAGSHTAAEMIAEIEEVSDTVTREIEILVGEKPLENPKETIRPWGIDFLSFRIKSPGLPKRVNVAMADRGKTEFDAQAKVITARAERTKLTEEGAGIAAARQALLTAEAVGTKALAEIAKLPEGIVVLQLEALKKAVTDGNVTVLPLNQSLIATLGSVTKTIQSLKT